MVELRIDRRIQQRVDAADVVQDAYLKAASRLHAECRDPQMPVLLWLRLIVRELLIDLHKHHLGAQIGHARLEISLQRGAMPEARRQPWPRCS